MTPGGVYWKLGLCLLTNRPGLRRRLAKQANSGAWGIVNVSGLRPLRCPRQDLPQLDCLTPQTPCHEAHKAGHEHQEGRADHGEHYRWEPEADQAAATNDDTQGP